jgi:hypothetical protein
VPSLTNDSTEEAPPPSMAFVHSFPAQTDSTEEHAAQAELPNQLTAAERGADPAYIDRPLSPARAAGNPSPSEKPARLPPQAGDKTTNAYVDTPNPEQVPGI